jgi:trimethylamine-N-oxide reductase (cytochrome c)
MFPLLVISNHPRWRTHAQGDDIVWARETPTGGCSGSTAIVTSRPSP